MTTTTSRSVIQALKSVFARHGIPEVVVSDNGPQYCSQEFKEFAMTYGFHQETSSPRYPQANRQAERTVQTVKKLIRKSDDPYMALLSYWATPFPWCGLSPAELLMGRQVRTSLPQRSESLVPEWTYLKPFRRSNDTFKQQQKKCYDERHRAHPVQPLEDDAPVWIMTDGQKTPGIIVAQANTPRSYVVNT